MTTFALIERDVYGNGPITWIKGVELLHVGDLMKSEFCKKLILANNRFYVLSKLIFSDHEHWTVVLTTQNKSRALEALN